MVTFNVKDEITINCPTSSNEITVDFLQDISKEIYLAPDYVLIGLIQGVKFADLAYANGTKNKNLVTTVLPVFIKAGDTKSEMISAAETKATVHISKSNIELGEHIRLSNNILTLQNIIQYLTIDDDLRRSIVTGKFFSDREISKDTRVFAIEFKVVPVSDIHGVFSKIGTIDNPFVKKIEK